MGQLDALRAFAVSAVMLHHFCNGNILSEHFPVGGTGLYLFFVLSGFLITGILRRGDVAARFICEFYLRRALRPGSFLSSPSLCRTHFLRDVCHALFHHPLAGGCGNRSMVKVAGAGGTHHYICLALMAFLRTTDKSRAGQTFIVAVVERHLSEC